MEPVAVIKVADGVKRAELVSLHQNNDKLFRKFATRVLGKAEFCNFTTISECEYGKKNVTSYTGKAIKEVMLAGEVAKILEEKF